MKKKIRALIIDDERLARKDLISLLSEYNFIEIAGEAENVETACRLIGETDPDVVFLDIQMPGASGFELLERCRVRGKIIFVTAFDEYALRAFEVNALDYLMKPVNPERLRDSLDRLEETSESDTMRPLKIEDRLFLMLDSQYRFLKVSEIRAIEASGDYTQLVLCSGEKVLTGKAMKEWESRLPQDRFVRIHRSTIIDMEAIDKMESWFNSSYRITLKGIQKPFMVSRRYAQRLKKQFE